MTAVAEMPSTKTGGKLSLPLKQLQHALAVVAPAVERKTTIPVLSTVKVEQTADALEFAATNLDLAIRVQVARKSVTPVPPFLLSALKLEAYARLLDGEDVGLSLTENRATLRCGRSVTKLPLMAAANFPNLHFGEAEAPKCSVPQSTLSRLLKHVTFAVSDEESRYILHGALLSVKRSSLALISTDGHRLAIYTVPFEHEGDELDILLPAGLLNALAKIIHDGDAPVRFQVDADAVYASVEDSSGSISLSHRRINGQFPNYQAVMPKGCVATLSVAAPAAAGALQRCVTFSDARSGAVKLGVAPQEIKLRSASADAGETDEVIDVDRCPDKFAGFDIGFNGYYLIDALSRLSGEVNLRFSALNNHNAMMLTAEPKDGERFEYVVMSMRVQ